MSDFLKAKTLLTEDIRLVLVKEEEVIISRRPGIAFLLELAEAESYQGYSAADRIVGKAAAFLYSRMQVKNVYGETMSRKALEVLKKARINFQYQILTDNILNRTNTGLCPMEQTVLEIEDHQKAFSALKDKIRQ